MGYEGEARERRSRFLRRRWMAPVLLVAAVPGLVVLVAALWLSFVGGGPDADPTIPPPAPLPFLDRATWWVNTGPGAVSSVATLMVLAALATLVITRPDDRALHPAVQSAAFWTTAAFGVLEASGPTVVLAGNVQLSRDPSLVSTYTPGLFDHAAPAVSLVLGILAGLLAWSLRWANRPSRPEAERDRSRAPVGQLAAEPPRRDVELHWNDEPDHLNAPRRQVRRSYASSSGCGPTFE